jgi:outer membrane receptor for ferrienterochelin and colicin
MKKNKLILKVLGFIFILFRLNTSVSYSQLNKVDIGIRFQKTVDLYYENGITGQYNFSKRVVFGASYITSRLGSAINSNAIKQDNFFISGAYLFRPNKMLQPFTRLNIGYFTADYESPIFNNLQNSSALLALDAGIIYSFKSPLKLNISLGYNAITGDGKQGAGTLYPVYFQTSVLWNLKKSNSK